MSHWNRINDGTSNLPRLDMQQSMWAMIGLGEHGKLGPPNYYAMTHRDKLGQAHEVSDRWQQALLFKRIAEEQWKKVQDVG